MQTQCPHCKSQYNIGADLVEAYGGFVRCGNCNYKFNIHDQVSPARHQDDTQARKEPLFGPGDEASSQTTQRIEPIIHADTDDDSLNIRFRELEEEYAADINYEPVLESELEAFDDELAHQESTPVFSTISEKSSKSDEIDLSEDDDFDADAEPIQEGLDSLASDAPLTTDNLDDIELDSDSDRLTDNLMSSLGDAPDEPLDIDDQGNSTDAWATTDDSTQDLAGGDILDEESDSLADLFDEIEGPGHQDKSSASLETRDWETVEDSESDLGGVDLLEDETDSLVELFDEADNAPLEADDHGADWGTVEDSEHGLGDAGPLADETDTLSDFFDEADDALREESPIPLLKTDEQTDSSIDWVTVEDSEDGPQDDGTDSLADLFDEADEGWQEDEEDNASRPIIFNLDAEQDFAQESRIPTLISDEQESTTSAKSLGFISAFSSVLMFAFWTAISIALVYLLFSQIKDKLYPGYINHPIVQNMRASACEYLPCSEVKYDTEAYEIVVSRMDEVNTPERELHISIFMMNKSNIVQVYPSILITLKRLDGSIAGQRAIVPEEYFKSYDTLADESDKGASEKQIIKPNKLGKVLIKLDNPPGDAVGFEARIVH